LSDWPARHDALLANTMLVAESGRVFGPWLHGGLATVRGLDPSQKPYVGPGRQFGGLHYDGRANVAFVDGSVRALSKTVSPKLFEALSTIADGESLPADWNSP
jgi:prepilin-type processing-associated H-X9-DG protein